MNPGTKIRPAGSLTRIGTVIRESVVFRGHYWVRWQDGVTEMIRRDLFVVVTGA